MKYKYLCTQPSLPPNAESPVMSSQQMEDWLNLMDKQGWEFISYAQKVWINKGVQDWWIFRKPR
jgi:hypothetical protein